MCRKLLCLPYFFIFKCKTSPFKKLSNKSKSELNTYKPKYVTLKLLSIFISIFFMHYCQAECYLKTN